MIDNNETGLGLEPVPDPRPVYKPVEGVKIGNFANHPAYKQSIHNREHMIRSNLIAGRITDMIVKCHVAAWDAGWWSDPKTGLPIARNVGEMLLLMVSELAEGAEGLDAGLMDDKLPHRRMIEVELADFHIRLYDFCGGQTLDLQAAYTNSVLTEAFNEVIAPRGDTPALWQITRHICDAMEAHRKGKRTTHIASLARAYRLSEWYAGMLGCDVEGAIEEKMAFNKVRPDHQLAARMAPGGKTY